MAGESKVRADSTDHKHQQDTAADRRQRDRVG
jgi:hypothetical protein